MAFMMVEKDPDAELSYTFNWTTWLNGETLVIANCLWVAPEGIDIITQQHEEAGESTVRLSGGTAGESYEVVNNVESSTGEKDNRTLLVEIREK
jgi:hypothetical protein